MRKQIKAAMIGLVLAAVVFLATPANAQNCSECPPGWTSLDYMFIFVGCEYVLISGVVYARCDYIPFKMGQSPVTPAGMQICESREKAPKTTAPIEDRNDAVKFRRSDSR
jgi:hypothetical protein